MKKLLKILLIIVLSAGYCGFIVYNVFKLPMNTDASCMMLYAKDILSGNLFLSGWSLTGLTFLTTDLPFYVIGVAIAGVGLNAFRIAVSLMYIFMAGSALAVSVYGIRNKKLAVLIMAAVGLFPTTYALSNAFVHTAVFALAFLAVLFAMKYNANPATCLLIIVGIITALAVSGDNMALVLITVPLIFLCLFKSFEKPVPIAISVFSGTAVGIAIQKLYLLIGGAELNSLPHQEFIEISELWHNISTYIEYFLRLINSYFFTKSIFSVKTAVFAVKILIALFALYIIYLAIKAVLSKKETDIPTAIFGISLSLLTLILWLTTLNANITAGRYIAFLPLVIGIVLTRCTDILPSLQDKSTSIAVAALCIILTAVNFVPRGGGLTPYNTFSELANFLEQNDLINGYAAFWDSSVITGYSNDKVRVRAVLYEEDKLQPHIWFCKKSWYEEPSNFIIVRNEGAKGDEEICNYNGIFNMRLDCTYLYGSYDEQLNGVTYDNVIQALGKPSKEKIFKNYSILIYDRISLG